MVAMRTCVLVVLAACSFRPSPSSPGGDGGGGGDAAMPGSGSDAGMITGDAGDWWNDAWMYRIPISIENSGSARLGSALEIAVPLALSTAPCASSGAHDDVRVVYGETEIARAIDTIPNGNVTWFRLVNPIDGSSTSTGEYWLYCGNGSAASVGDRGSDVFDFYDPFDTLDGGVWQIVSGATASNGMLVLGNNGDTGVVTNASFTDVGYAVDFAATAQMSTITWWGGFQSGTPDLRPWSLWYQPATDPGHVSPSYIDTNGAAQIWEGSDDNQDTNEHIYSVENYDTAAIWRLDDAMYQTNSYAPLGVPPSTFGIRLWSNMTPNPGISFDWVRLRKANRSESASVGVAETR
jgi:hypothetical protein